MSIENMTSVSYILFAISGVFAVAAVVLFFVLDIAKCWRMVSGKHTVRGEKRKKANNPKAVKAAKTEQLRHAGTEKIVTEKIRDSEVFTGSEETALLQSLADEERTKLLDTKSLEIVQDIVYVQDTIEIG